MHCACALQHQSDLSVHYLLCCCACNGFFVICIADRPYLMQWRNSRIYTTLRRATHCLFLVWVSISLDYANAGRVWYCRLPMQFLFDGVLHRLLVARRLLSTLGRVVFVEWSGVLHSVNKIVSIYHTIHRPCRSLPSKSTSTSTCHMSRHLASVDGQNITTAIKIVTIARDLPQQSMGGPDASQPQVPLASRIICSLFCLTCDSHI